MHGTTRAKVARHVVALIFGDVIRDFNDAGVSGSEVNEESVGGIKWQRVAQRREL